ncbi:MAG: FtsL-like putative cell division protein [Bacteroidales bacterium]|mgnify:CR=1 FL=1|nr:FtsL-like putative cell division protein [Bacteroidales bacterium]MDD4669880.1 FtsL-like putative cell division protein [Bacteroidales bacterium]
MAETQNRLIDKFIGFFSGDKIFNKLVKYVGFIFYVFVLICGTIIWSLTVESKLVHVEKNEKIIEELEINYHQKTLDLIGINKRSKIEYMLKECNSTLHPPVEPAKRIKIEQP